MPTVENVVARTAARGVLTEADVESSVAEGLASLNLVGQRVLVVVPDRTRTMPLPLFFKLLAKHLLPQARAVDFLVALGTHPALSEEAMLDLFGLTAEERARHANVRFLN